MNKFYIAAGAILASSLVVSLPEKAQALSELGPNGVKMPVVSTSDYYTYEKEFVLSKTGKGTQYITGSSDAAIRDMITGRVVRPLFKDMNSVIVNDNEDLFIAARSYDEEVAYATKLDDAQILDEDLEMEKVYGFIYNTNIFVGGDSNTLKAYNYDTKQTVFETNLNGKRWNLYTVKKDIAVASENNVTIYDANGNYVDVLQFNSKVLSIEYSPNGDTLLVGTEDENVQVFNALNNYLPDTNKLFNNTKNAEDIRYDATGDYVIIVIPDNGYGFISLFSLKDQQRIYTELDNKKWSFLPGRTLLSNNAQFIKIRGITYNAKNITKSPKSISLPTQYITMEAGSELKPAVTAKLLDGTTTTVTDGVTWKSDDLSVAYYDEDKKVFKPTSEGTFTLRASYLGFTTDVEVKVTKSAMSEIKAYLAKHTKSGYYILSAGVKDIYLDQRIYKGSSYKGKHIVTTFTGKKNGKPVTYLDIARKANSSINFKQIEIQANGKTFKKNTKPYYYKGYESADIIKLSTADRKWIKENIDVNKSVTVKLKGTKKTVTIKLTKTQKDALLKGVLVNDYLK